MKNVYSLLGGCTIVYMGKKRGFGEKNRSKTVNKHHVEAPEDS